MTRQCTVIIVAPSLSDPGGIASVVSAYMASDLPDRRSVQVVETVRGRGVRRHVRGWLGVVRALWAIAEERSCLVHVHMSFGGSFWRKAAIIAWAKLLRRPALLHLHGSRFHTWATSGTAVRRMAVRRVFGMADCVVVLSRSWAERVSGFAGRDDAVVLPNPALVPERASSGRDGGPVVFLGRLGERKGIYELVEAIRALQEEGVGVQWVLAGDGDVESVSSLVAGLPHPASVSVPGWLGARETTALLDRASVFCLPSTDEGVPMALLEAMAYGLACVVTPVGGIPEVIVDGQNGVLVPVRNADALAEGLRSVLLDAPARLAMGDRARETVISRYAVDKVVDELDRLYVSLGCEAK